MVQLLNEQIAHEKYNASKYLKLGSRLKNKGLENIGAHFSKTQYEEENSHASMIANYLTDRNADVEALGVEPCNEVFDSIIAIGQSYLAQEQLTTQRLENIARIALQDMDFLTFKFAQDMLEIQRVEEDEAQTFLDKSLLTGGDWAFILIWDANF